MKIRVSSLFVYLSLAVTLPAALPDLLIHGPSARPYIDVVNFTSGSCEVAEGCVVPGTRRLLRFETESRNVGDADLIFGDPARNPMFVWDNCHGHYHFGQFTEYRLLTTTGTEVVEGKKIGFCLEDTIRWNPNAGGRIYNCAYQGIQRGWADVYTYDIPCQWIDITGVAGGTYILEMRADPLNRIPELNEDNNVTQVTVVIPSDCSVRPSNDNYASAEMIFNAPTSLSGNNACATKESGERSHAGDSGGHSVWYRWTPASSKQVIINTEGSSFDTLLAVYRVSGSTLTVVAENDDIVHQVIRVSQVSFAAQAGVEYRIAIDGWGGEIGSYKLNVDAPGNDHFANATQLQGMEGQITSHNIGATREPGEPTHVSTYGNHSVWYYWKAPRFGVMVWDTLGSSFDTTLAVYRGSSVGGLTALAGDNDSGPNGTSITRMSVSSNETYRIVVDGRGNDSGNIRLNWRFPMARLTSRRQPPNQVVVSLFGEDGTYQVQSSTNLLTWSNHSTVNVVNGVGSLSVPGTAGPQFYRARMVP